MLERNLELNVFNNEYNCTFKKPSSILSWMFESNLIFYYGGHDYFVNFDTLLNSNLEGRRLSHASFFQHHKVHNDDSVFLWIKMPENLIKAKNYYKECYTVFNGHKCSKILVLCYYLLFLEMRYFCH